MRPQAEDVTDRTDGTDNVPTEQPEPQKDEMIGRSLTEDEADDLILESAEHAVPMPQLEMTPENWNAEFGPEGKVQTPIGDVKIGDNQYAKMVEKGRTKELGMIKPTLTAPDFIIEEESEGKDGKTSRYSSYLFVKAFIGGDGKAVFLQVRDR